MCRLTKLMIFYIGSSVHSPQYKMSEIQAAHNTFSFVKIGLTKENVMRVA
jgi:hypothetical protein